MPRDLEYEKNNKGYDFQYPYEEGGGIKCKNYEICNAVLPKWWYDCKGNYLCINCDMLIGELPMTSPNVLTVLATVELVCSTCKESMSDERFSKAQRRKGECRRCQDCVQAALPKSDPKSTYRQTKGQYPAPKPILKLNPQQIKHMEHLYTRNWTHEALKTRLLEAINGELAAMIRIDALPSPHRVFIGDQFGNDNGQHATVKEIVATYKRRTGREFKVDCACCGLGKKEGKILERIYPEKNNII